MTGPVWSGRKIALAALLTAAAYWVGARVGLALTFGSTPVAALWPPNAILLAALLVAPTSSWWILVLAVLPAHVAAELSDGVPASMVASWFVSNALEAVLGAALVRRFLPGRPRLDTARSFGVFVVCASVGAAFLTSFLDAALVQWNQWGDSPYWTTWRIRFLSNLLATQTIVPVALVVDGRLLTAIRSARPRRQLEALALGVSLLLACWVAFWLPKGLWPVGPALLCAPLSLLLWAAVRFGPAGISVCLGVVTIVAISGAAQGAGPFTALEPENNAFSLQLFLFLTGVPLWLLAATIEERRRAELKAAESERLLSMTIKTAHIGIWAADLETNHFAADEELRRMIGDPEEDGSFYSALIERIFVSPRGSPGERTSGGGNGGPFLPDREVEVQRPDGTTRWIIARGMLLRRPDGTPFRIMGIAIDITERKRIEETLREHDERMSLVATTANIGFWTRELATGEVWLSHHCYALLRAPEDTAPAAVLERLVPRSIVWASATQVEQWFGGRGAIEEAERVRRADGAERWIASSARLERNAAGQPIRVIGVSRDITDQRAAERDAAERRQALAHLSRVATVGELTATIVHEVGQPLGAIILNAQAAHRLSGVPDIDVTELRAVASDLLRDARRASTLVGRLRDLLRRDEVARERLDLRVVVEDALELARAELMRVRIEVTASMADEPVFVMANRAQLQQVLLNLILNARDAINAAAPDRRQLLITVTKGANGVASVWVADSGGGIAREHLGHVFEPFFTSKSEGLGLGLAVSRSIMLDHGGDLRAENLDGGAVMEVTLPEARARAPASSATAERPAPRPQVYSQQLPGA